jgi:hypothetical protein
LEDEDIRNKKPELAEAVRKCLETATYELDADTQKRLLKAASYGKTFLNASQTDHNAIYEVCKYLRVVYNLRDAANLQRTVTYH